VLEENNIYKYTQLPYCNLPGKNDGPESRPPQQLHNLSDCDYTMEKCPLLIRHRQENQFFFSKIFAYLALASAGADMQTLWSRRSETTGCCSQSMCCEVEPCTSFSLRMKTLSMHSQKKLSY